MMPTEVTNFISWLKRSSLIYAEATAEAAAEAEAATEAATEATEAAATTVVKAELLRRTMILKSRWRSKQLLLASLNTGSTGVWKHGGDHAFGRQFVLLTILHYSVFFA
jgi:hypothetical protein